MAFLIIIIAVLVAVFLVQIGKARELASAIREDNSEEYENNNYQAAIGMVFMVGFLVLCVVSFIYYIPYILGWGPNTAASKHGPSVRYLIIANNGSVSPNTLNEDHRSLSNHR
jgi:cytochrome c oxidase subunit 2